MLAVTLSVLTLTIITWLLWRKKQFSTLKELGIPGPEPDLLFGNLWDLFRKGTLVCHQEWAKKYGKVFGYYFGTKPVILVNDLELLKKIQISDFHKFINRPALFQISRRDPNDRSSLFYALTSLRDKRWKDIRSILTPSFTTSKMKIMAPIINNALDTFLEKIDEKAKHDEPFDIYELYQGLTMDVIGRTAFGIQTECQKNPEDPFLSAARVLFTGNISSVVTLLAFSFPELQVIWRYVRRFRLSSRNKGVDPLQVMLDSVVAIIRERRKDIKKRRNDLLQLMIDANMAESDLSNISGKDLTASSEINEKSDDTKKSEDSTPKTQKSLRHMTDEEIVQNALLFFLAGYETTSTALAFITHLLIYHQDVQEKVRQEINELMEREGKLDYGSVHQLQYLDQVVTEALRVYPPVFLFVNREVSEDMELGSFRLKKGLPVQVNTHLIQHDEELWSEPEKFDPDRFAPEKKGQNNPLAYQVFGAGPRNCVGLRFAQMEEKLTLARLLHKYRLAVCDKSDKRDVTINVGAAGLKPKHGVYLKAVPV